MSRQFDPVKLRIISAGCSALSVLASFLAMLAIVVPVALVLLTLVLGVALDNLLLGFIFAILIVGGLGGGLWWLITSEADD